MASLEEFLAASASLHRHLCPRQVLGVRMGMMAGRLLDLCLPQSDNRLLTIVETDGCFADGVSAATGCWVGRRTLRLEDFGKVAATFVDTRSGRAARIAPSAEARTLAGLYAPEAANKWEAYLIGYQHMPEELLLSWQSVTLTSSIEAIVSHAGRRAVCEACGEEIVNEREIIRQGNVLCRACAGQAYYAPLEPMGPKPAAFSWQSPTGYPMTTVGLAVQNCTEIHELYQTS
jgi:formylmethanofuran dehydrogenase subunit E